MPGSFQKISLMTYLRVLAPHPNPETDRVDLSQMFALLSPQTISTTLARPAMPLARSCSKAAWAMKTSTGATAWSVFTDHVDVKWYDDWRHRFMTKEGGTL